jgi:Carboxypeptidase regulatory-like domain
VRKHWTVVLIAWMALMVATAAANQKGESELRTVRGTVVDKQDSPLASGVVYLKNLRTLTVKTYISDDNGQYRFSGLDPNVDYEIHAEHKDLTSAKRTISSFDSRKEIVINLKTDKKKTER